jgi:alkanesulfonate monooxygenase SsuD/methylene tetrahydromethanopterin reductase-like flavin-dependent oxidoreductase (luciferase family)
VPIWLGAEGPKNIAMTAEIADGWLPIYFSPKVAGMYNGWLDEGFARPGARGDRASFEIATNCTVVITDDVDGTLDAMKPTLGFYIGGMGAKDMNFHKEVFSRMGYEAEANEIQDLFFAGERDKAIATVPRQMVADISLVGPAAKIRDDLSMWEDAGVTMLVIGARDLDEMRRVAEVILG